jgi:hypothetical protein
MEIQVGDKIRFRPFLHVFGVVTEIIEDEQSVIVTPDYYEGNTQIGIPRKPLKLRESDVDVVS